MSMAMKKRTVATWIVVGALATGAGVALAETSPPSPAVDPVTTTTTADSATTTTAVPDSTTTTTAPETTSTTAPPETTTTLAPTTTTTAPGGGEGTHPWVASPRAPSRQAGAGPPACRAGPRAGRAPSCGR